MSGEYRERGESSMTMVYVEATVAGRRRGGRSDPGLAVRLPDGPTTLGALIEAIVRCEVDAHIGRVNRERVLRVLTGRALSEGLLVGAVSCGGGRGRPVPVDPDEAVATAFQAQIDGHYRAVVDDLPLDRLDEVFDLRDGTRVMFVRLVPLVGG